MMTTGLLRSFAVLAVLAMSAPRMADAADLTADEAVRIATE